MIHLYNAMLQLSLPKFIQQPLILKIVCEMYQRRLEDCELEILDSTIGRLNAYSVQILDPVLNHFIGTYGLRSKDDRSYNPPVPIPEPPKVDINRNPLRVPISPTSNRARPAFLRYTAYKPGRKDFEDDTVVIAPKLSILGHAIRHWSNVRRSGNAAAAFTAYPLNAGVDRKYWRRGVEAANSNISRPEYTYLETYLLKRYKEYHHHPPGVRWQNLDLVSEAPVDD